MANFDIAIEKILKYECPTIGSCYVNDPDDPGGETNFGISKRAFPNVDIKNLTRNDAKGLYRLNYWIPLRLAEIDSQSIAEEMLDIGVNMGVSVAVRLAQLAYNLLTASDIHVDGIIGPMTIQALNESRYPKALAKTMNGLQFYRYIKIIESNPAKEKFFRAWLMRVDFGG
jgi:lysozyme family protein